jgi:hypothetical protein
VVAAAGLAAAAFVFVPGQAASSTPVSAVMPYAELMPAPAGDTLPPAPGSSPAAPTAVGGPLRLTAHGVRIQLRYYRLGQAELVVATADRPFAMPMGAHESAPGQMAWSARLDGVSLFSPSSRVLVASRLPADQLAQLASRIPQ